MTDASTPERTQSFQPLFRASERAADVIDGESVAHAHHVRCQQMAEFEHDRAHHVLGQDHGVAAGGVPAGVLDYASTPARKMELSCEPVHVVCQMRVGGLPVELLLGRSHKQC